MRALLLAPLLLILAAASCPGDPGNPRKSPPLAGGVAADLDRLLAGAGETRAVLARASGTRDRRYVLPLFELLRFPTAAPRAEVGAALDAITGERLGGDWSAWYEWIGRRDDLPAVPGFATWKGELYAKFVDPAMRRFLDGSRPSTVRVELIQWGGVRVDNIPALADPAFVKPAEATYLTPEDRVFGVEVAGDARAYPLRILDWHEMANDVVGGEPVSLAYCTLCGAGVLYRTAVRGTTYTFGSSGFLYESNKLMYDRQTGTLWNQLTGEPVNGPLAESGIVLERLPVVVTTWGKWLAQHPKTRVLSLATGYARDYRPGLPYGSYFASDETMFPVARKSSALPEKAEVFALLLDGTPKAYPVEKLAAERITNDTVGSRAVVLHTEPDTRAVRAYERGAATFARTERAALGSTFLVDQNGRPWRLTEAALLGPGGEKLPRLPGHLAYWFGWYSFYPRTLVYGQEGPARPGTPNP